MGIGDLHMVLTFTLMSMLVRFSELPWSCASDIPKHFRAHFAFWAPWFFLGLMVPRGYSSGFVVSWFVYFLGASSAGGTPTCFAVRERPAKLPLLFVSISGNECFVLIVFMCRLCLSGLCVFLGLHFSGVWCSALEVA